MKHLRKGTEKNHHLLQSIPENGSEDAVPTMPLWCEEYFELTAIKKKHTQERLSYFCLCQEGKEDS